MFYRYRFESEIYPELSRIPLHVRMKLDLTGVKISLKAWLAFTLEEREILCRLPVETEEEKKAYSNYLDALSQRHFGQKVALVSPATDPPWEDRDSVADAVTTRSREAGRAVTRAEWSRWNSCQRYALFKLAISKNEPEQFSRALEEFREEPAKRLSAVILAGGKSSRFGKDKSRMELSGKQVVERQAVVLREFPFQQIVVMAAAGKTASWPDGLLTLVDDQEGLGPIGGITTALRHFPGGILVTACDMPFISTAMIEWLLDQDDSEADAVIPRHPGGIEPLFGIYNPSLLPELEQAVRSGRYALHYVLKKTRVRFVEVPERFSVARDFANINTPEDYERIVKMMEKPK